MMTWVVIFEPRLLIGAWKCHADHILTQRW